MAQTSPTQWAIIGTGTIAHAFADGLKALPDAHLLAVSSREISKANAFAQTHHIPHPYASHQEMLQNPDIQAVYIAAPHTAHKQLALDCIDVGKAVLVEKPFTLNAAEAKEIIDRAQQKGVFCMEAMWMRFTPLMRHVKELMTQQVIGDIRLIEVSLGFKSPYDPQNRFFNLELGGGALLDLGVYPLNFIFWLLGQPDTIQSSVHIGSTGVDEQAGIILGYQTGPVAVISTSNRTYCANEALIQGENGSLRIHDPLVKPEYMTLRYFHTTNSGSGTSSSIKDKARQFEPARKVYHRLKRLKSSLGNDATHIPCPGNGYQYEAAEVQNCLRAGKLESDNMPLAETLQIMQTMDTLRSQWHLQYPQEKTK